MSVDAFDVVGTLTSGTTTPPAYTRYEQGNGDIVKVGTWTDYTSAASCGASYGRASTALASATIYFTGTRLDWIATKGTTTGIADVYLDGVKKATVNLAATAVSYQVDVWTTGTVAAVARHFSCRLVQ